MYPYYSASQYYKDLFGVKAYKIAVDAGCTCPNRDGTKGYGGCIFCSHNGSGDFVPERSLSVPEQIREAKLKVIKKLQGRSGVREGKYIAYFQNFTSTYGDSKSLVKKYKEALLEEDVLGIDIATRPDCLGDDILKEIADISKNTFVTVELGLQSSSNGTGEKINRKYTTEDYFDAVKRIKKASSSIHVVTHVIAGLPGEDKTDFLNSIRSVVDAGSDGIKITVLYVLKDTVLNKMYQEGSYEPLSLSEYAQWLWDALMLLPEKMVVHRITGDPPKKELVSPSWTMNKREVMNYLTKYMNSKVCGD